MLTKAQSQEPVTVVIITIKIRGIMITVGPISALYRCI